LRARIEIFLSGRPPDDPLYLTNRTWQQKAEDRLADRRADAAADRLVTIGATNPFRFHKVDPYEHPPTEAPPPAVPQKRSPDPILAAEDLEVVNIRIARDARPPVVTGTVRNNTNQKVDSAEVSYYLADIRGQPGGHRYHRRCQRGAAWQRQLSHAAEDRQGGVRHRPRRAPN
jgi:hypothetical protein